jgi:N utilization substance protein B
VTGPARQARSVARLAAVQALYQMEVSSVGAEAVIREAFFADLVRGVVAHQGEVDKAVAKRLAQNWRLERIDATVRAILRAGAYELTHRADVPTEVVIDEYVELAKSFFEGPEPGFVNGALDGVAQDVRR